MRTSPHVSHAIHTPNTKEGQIKTHTFISPLKCQLKAAHLFCTSHLQIIIVCSMRMHEHILCNQPSLAQSAQHFYMFKDFHLHN